MKSRTNSKQTLNDLTIEYSLELTNQSQNQTRKHSLSDDIESQDPNNQLIPKPKNEEMEGYLVRIKNYCYNFWYDNRYELINKMISIFLHIFIMIVFEIYFYFNYVVIIERDKFMEKIDSYYNDMDIFDLTSAQSLIVENMLVSNRVETYLYNKYLSSLDRQKTILKQLLFASCQMAGIIGIILIVFGLCGLVYRKNIKWKWILSENVLMFLFLGIFEYFFFTNIILKYDPVTDDEIRYYAYNGLIKYLNNTN